MSSNEQLRQLPSVDQVLGRLNSNCPRDLLAAETRRVIEDLRDRMKAGERPDVSTIPQRVLESLAELERNSLHRVINATGVVLHTNLGRAPLPDHSTSGGYSNLEYDLETGQRGKRDVHVGGLIERLTGKPGIVVNNNAAAVYLVLNELAAGGEVIVSRGELIEIGDGFRIPEIMLRAGAVLHEVGTTNRTRLEDYRSAINDRTRMILKVHPSNFRVEGFAGKPSVEELGALSREAGLPLYEDLGSGCLVDLRPFGVHEPSPPDSLRSGVNLVSFSGDKLLGGPQAGILAGDPELISRLRRNPMFRAFRVDKLIYSALESTLRNILFCRWDQIPALRMIALTADTIRQRASRLVDKLQLPDVDLEQGASVIGGGSTPQQSIPTWLVTIGGPVMAVEKRLRASDPPVVARIENDRLVIDLRTVLESEEEQLASVVSESVRYARSM